jgi:hypothetical protein
MAGASSPGMAVEGTVPAYTSKHRCAHTKQQNENFASDKVSPNKTRIEVYSLSCASRAEYAPTNLGNE